MQNVLGFHFLTQISMKENILDKATEKDRKEATTSCKLTISKIFTNGVTKLELDLRFGVSKIFIKLEVLNPGLNT